MRLAIRILFLSIVVLSVGCGAGTTDQDVPGQDASDQELTDMDVPGQDLPDQDLPDQDLPGSDVALDSSNPDVSDVTPEFDPLLASTLQNMLEEHIAFSSDAGLTLTIGTPAGAWWTGAVGMADLTAGKALEPDSQFRVGSNTKPIVATVILQLMEEGKIDLDEPLTTYLPQYTEWSDITVRMLLNMRSGLNEFLNVQPCLLSVMLAPTTAFTPEEILQFVLDSDDNGRLFPADTDGYYSNTNYVLLGLIIEAVSDKTAEQEIQERILDPLGMTNTYLDDGTGDDSNLVQGYIDFNVAGAVVGVSPTQAAMIPNVQYVDGLIVGTHLMHASVTWTSGALVSTSRDMARFVYALMNGHLLKPETMDEMAATQAAALLGGLTQYGLGLQNIPSPEGETWGHGGLNFGYQTQTWYLPESGITISHIHNFLLNWYDAFQNEIVAMVKKGGDATFNPCVAPEGLYADGSSGTFLNMAFKGVVTASDAVVPEYGIGKFKVVDENGITPVAGLYPAAIQGRREDQDILTLEAFGASPDGVGDLVKVSIELREGLFDGLASDGTKTIVQENAGDMFVVVQRLYYETGTKIVNKSCITGLSLVTEPGTAYLCEGNRDGMPVAGDTLRIMASMPVSSDEEYIDSALMNGLPGSRCHCLNGTTWEPCEQ